MQISRIDHIVLTVADIAATSEFYSRALNMQVLSAPDKPVRSKGCKSLTTKK